MIAHLPPPDLWAGPTVNPYCTRCGVKREGGLDRWQHEQARSRARSETIDEVLWGVLVILGAAVLVLIIAYGGG